MDTRLFSSFIAPFYMPISTSWPLNNRWANAILILVYNDYALLAYLFSAYCDNICDGELRPYNDCLSVMASFRP